MLCFFWYRVCCHRIRPLLTHSFPTRLSADLVGQIAVRLHPLGLAKLLLPLPPFRDIEQQRTQRRCAFPRQRETTVLEPDIGAVPAYPAQIRIRAAAGSHPADRKSTRLNSSH